MYRPPLKDRSTSASVLVIDDHPIVIDGVRQLLEREADFNLIGEAANGEEGVALAQRLAPDVVVLDLKLGDNFAPHLCRALLEVSGGSRVVIHTAFDDREPLRACLDAVRAMAHRHVVGVEGEDLAFGVALLELDSDDRFLNLSLEGSLEDPATHVVGQKQHTRDLLRDGARAGPLSVEHVFDGGDDNTGRAEAEVLLEVRVLTGKDRLAKDRRDVVVVNHHTPLDGEFANHLRVACEQAGDRAGLVAVEGADLG